MKNAAVQIVPVIAVPNPPLIVIKKSSFKEISKLFVIASVPNCTIAVDMINTIPIENKTPIMYKMFLCVS